MDRRTPATWEQVRSIGVSVLFWGLLALIALSFFSSSRSRPIKQTESGGIPSELIDVAATDWANEKHDEYMWEALDDIYPEP
jgi:hypothetical protein